ncbi:unnamed protein product [Hydatigera taeniaeformis]|uniref:PDZ domain-containing protein n=1 Tax=Hydatigena taeniaeformis TaxID=6205 RepID=A0A0R3WZM2_HYDTA|nr:unnamed protein product [Hydatigera taeniaeformis]
MSSLTSSSSAISSSEEDVSERRQEELEGANDHKEAVESPDSAGVKVDEKVIDGGEEKNAENKDENDDKDLVIEYTVEINQTEDKSNEKEDDFVSYDVKTKGGGEVEPIPESAKIEAHESEPKELPKEEMKAPALMSGEVQPSPQPLSNGEVVEEVPRSVKEQVAIFSNLNLQKASDAPKLVSVSGFAIDHSNQNTASSISVLPALSTQTPRVATIYKNVSPQPFGSSETNTSKQADRQPTVHPVSQCDTTMVERPQQLDRSNDPTPQSKKFGFKAVTSTPPMTFCVPFGGGGQSGKSTESPVKEVSPSQYLGPGVISQTSRPPMMIRLRRPGSEAPWGFAIFGGADYGCPPFISRVRSRNKGNCHLRLRSPHRITYTTSELTMSREEDLTLDKEVSSDVTLHSIAAKAGLEVGDVVVSICDAPVQEKEHSRIKAEILRAGNELDFLVVKQGIDKDVLAQRAPHLLRTPAQEVAYTGQPLRAAGTWTSAVSPTHTDKATRTRSFRLLDEHLNAMSVQPPQVKVTASQPARVFSPNNLIICQTQSYHHESTPRSSYATGRNQQTVYSPMHSPSMSHGFYGQPQPQSASEMSTNRSHFATPVGLSQGSEAWRNTSPTRGGNDFLNAPSHPGTRSSSVNQQMTYQESRNALERFSIDDPSLMTQYYGTQQTCYAKYQPQSQHHQQRMLHQESSYQSSSEWNRISPQQSVPTSRLVYRPPVLNFATTRETKDQFRQHNPKQQYNFISGWF